ncbi:MAG: glycerol-3-phosphate dehydrogenase [Pseudomonadota bacterium]
MTVKPFDLFIIGGGVNGCGVARDASGRGLRVGLAEMNDLGSATSSASTKLFHGGLRYLEFFEFNLVRESLEEREILLRAMPHISWPMRFVLPYAPGMVFDPTTPLSRGLRFLMPWLAGRRPAWLIRAGLFLYDHMGGREILPGTRRVDLDRDPVGVPLRKEFTRAFEYSDCWVDDARLVVLNAVDAYQRGATIMPRTKVIQALRVEEKKPMWEIHTQHENGSKQVFYARVLVNAAGPWVTKVIGQLAQQDGQETRADTIRLVRGSHIITHKLFNHPKSYFFLGEDGRIVFAIPYLKDYTLIGTTDVPHESPDEPAVCSPWERDYLCAAVSRYLHRPVEKRDIIATYSGVRPLYEDGAVSATAASRDYFLRLDDAPGAPLLTIYGGKITTYRRLAQAVLTSLEQYFPAMGPAWTGQGAPLPGGDFPVDGFANLVDDLASAYPFAARQLLARLARTYGTMAHQVLAGAKTKEDLGAYFGADIYARELDWSKRHEWVVTAQDFTQRRTKTHLWLEEAQMRAIDAYLQS